MTATHMHTIARAATGSDVGRGRGRSSAGRRVLLLAAVTIVGTAACADSNVPFFTEPTGVANSPGGIQNAMTGLFAASRIDVGTYVNWMTQFARDQGNIQFSNPQDVLTGTGGEPIPSGDIQPWSNSYRAVGAAIAIIAAVPNVQPAFSPDTVAAVVGVAQTLEALNLMQVAETRDTLPIPIHTAADGSAGTVLCSKDAWAEIVAILDSANTSLTTAGAIALPFKVPSGFASVALTAGPSTTAGSFASFNRALAGKANLELAYAIARANGVGPTPSAGGSPDVAALTAAQTALTASALTAIPLTTPAPGGFTENSAGVFWDYSSQSGDIVNPVNAQAGIWQTLIGFTRDVDTTADARWLAKFVHQTHQLQIPADLPIADTNWFYAYYPSTSTPLPIIRNENLKLYEAQIQLGLGNFLPAIALINQVHQQAGGFASPLTIAATYTAVRDSLLKEQRISTVFEASGDRAISIRMYGLQTVALTTWGATDLHTTLLPIPTSEVGGRGGNYTATCN
jgi:hypothetical protein